VTTINKKTHLEINNSLDSKDIENILKEAKTIRDSKEFGFRNEEDFIISSLLGFKHKIFEIKGSNRAEPEDINVWIEDYLKTPKDKRVRKVVVFDTETTDYNGFVVSIAAKLYDLETRQILKEEYRLVNPKAIIVDSAYQVHKISQEEAEKHPEFKEIWLKYFSGIFEEADLFVGQNLSFDVQILSREFLRANIENPFSKYCKIFDTMLKSRPLKVFTTSNGRNKAGNLEELVDYFGIEKDDSVFHNAEYDVMQTLNVFKAFVEPIYEN